MKCSVAECKALAKRIHTMGFDELEKRLNRCNNCFFSHDPAERYDRSFAAYETRNEVGGLYAKLYQSRS